MDLVAKDEHAYLVIFITPKQMLPLQRVFEDESIHGGMPFAVAEPARKVCTLALPLFLSTKVRQ